MSSVWSSHACKFEYWVHLNYSKISSTTSPKRLNNTLNQFELPIFEFYTVLVYAFWNPTFRPTQASLRKTWCLPFQAGEELCKNGFTRYPTLPSLYHLASIQHLQRRAINLSEFNTDWNLHLLKLVWFELQAIKWQEVCGAKYWNAIFAILSMFSINLKRKCVSRYYFCFYISSGWSKRGNTLLISK
jgi:hypothetical protein